MPTTLDDQTRSDHACLSARDQCWYLASYVAGPGYRAGPINQLVANLKCLPTHAALHPRRALHKRRAIHAVAAMLREALPREWIEAVTWIPVPPSHAIRDADYDDRLLCILRRAFRCYDADVRNVLYQTCNTKADHFSGTRMRASALFDAIRVNRHVLAARPVRKRLMLFDDVLTTGKHFKCCELHLRQFLPERDIGGLFIARRALSGRWRRLP